jgi:ribosomal protein S18 acetylase RimI-like enzyme
MRLEIRPFRPGDLPLLKAITAEAFDGVSIDQNIEQQYGVVNARDWRRRKGRQIEQDIARDPSGTFIAEIESEVAGYVTTWVDREEGVGFIRNLAVSAPHRRRGVGRKLIEHALDHFRKCGVSLARIETLEQNQAGQQMFPSCGFREAARQIHYCMQMAEEPIP